MAGNVKEWVWNESGHGRYLLGGAWNDHPYMYINDTDARSRMVRKLDWRGETVFRF
jgi:formylglycine-generating enzyme required for sulfatase activity